jgi:hypothetical protein
MDTDKSFIFDLCASGVHPWLLGGVIGYLVKETVALQAGYRYLNVNYRGGGATQPVFDTHFSGVVIGVTFNLE